jgi:hypothetical protein
VYSVWSAAARAAALLSSVAERRCHPERESRDLGGRGAEEGATGVASERRLPGGRGVVNYLSELNIDLDEPVNYLNKSVNYLAESVNYVKNSVNYLAESVNYLKQSVEHLKTHRKGTQTRR